MKEKSFNWIVDGNLAISCGWFFVVAGVVKAVKFCNFYFIWLDLQSFTVGAIVCWKVNSREFYLRWVCVMSMTIRAVFLLIYIRVLCRAEIFLIKQQWNENCTDNTFSTQHWRFFYVAKHLQHFLCPLRNIYSRLV